MRGAHTNHISLPVWREMPSSAELAKPFTSFCLLSGVKMGKSHIDSLLVALGTEALGRQPSTLPLGYL
ncbi:rCG30336 [Rattus norvegicus]|uniref:RCG30336 n=1 Tax=Rattus norvegicus TaxID=10116 RepID=A6IN30_RAT|nr:rCG30336 [Rattus norvegicus]